MNILATLIDLPATIIRAFRGKEEVPVFYIVWYADPRTPEHRTYLCIPPSDIYYYSHNMNDAHRFTSYDEAYKAMPVYDGSNHIEQRTGIVATV